MSKWACVLPRDPQKTHLPHLPHRHTRTARTRTQGPKAQPSRRLPAPNTAGKGSARHLRPEHAGQAPQPPKGDFPSRS